MTSNTPAARRIPVWILALALVLVTLAVYSPTLHNGFVDFDDPGYILNNPHVRTGFTFDNIAWAFTSFDMGNWHPVTWLSHMLDCRLYGLSPAGHHATSIVLHALNALLLFLLLQAATGAPWRSLMVAALFAVHPLNVESVSWLSERKSLLCMLFSLVAVGLYARYAASPSRSRYCALVAAFLLALMSKPMAVTLPALLLLLDYWPLRRFDPASPDRIATLRHLVVEKLPLFALCAASAVVTILAQHHGEAVSSLARLPLSVRLANAAVSTAIYLRRLVWPNDLAYFYPHRGSNLPPTQAVAAFAVLAAIATLVWIFRRHRPLVFGILFFAIAIAPVIGILQVGLQSMADRYAYLPFLGLFTAIVWELSDLALRIRIPSFARRLVGILVIGVFATVAVHTQAYWHDSVALFTRAHDVTPLPNLYIETNLAAALLDRGDFDSALEHFRLAEQVAPQSFVPHFNIGVISLRTGEIPTAIFEFTRASRCNTTPQNQALALYNLGATFAAAGDRQHALATYQDLERRFGPSEQVDARIAELLKK